MSDHVHAFDPVSGWCTHCAYRQDGRLMSFAGDEYRPGPNYTPQELLDILTDLKTKATTR